VYTWRNSRATLGYAVRVDVAFTLNGQTHRTQTSFAPR
jgi:hypothetical protein